MLRIFSILLFVVLQLVLTPIYCAVSLAGNEIEDTGKSEEDIMKEINELLEAEKSKSDGFKEEDVKVDLESLGLDEIGVFEGDSGDEIEPKKMQQGISPSNVEEKQKATIKDPTPITQFTDETGFNPKTYVSKDEEALSLPKIPVNPAKKANVVEKKVTTIKDTGKSEEDIMKEINNLLESNKDDSDAFKEEDVKVDIESLGLDEIDDFDTNNVNIKEGKVISDKSDAKAEPKDAAKKEEAKTDLSLPVISVKPEPKLKPVENKKQNNLEFEKLKEDTIQKITKAKPIESTKTKPVVTKPVQTETSNEKANPTTSSNEVMGGSKPSSTKPSSFSKIQKFLDNTAGKVVNAAPALGEVDAKKVTKVVSKKKEKRKLTKSEQIQADKLAKLNALRDQYLIKIDSKESNDFDRERNEDFSDDNIKIVPKRRGINKFSLYEVPAPPIADSYRTKDNIHIPVVLTYGQKIAILFNAIKDNDNVSYFKSAYEDVGRSDIRNNTGDTILTYAMLLQRHSIVASLLSLGADPNLPSGLGYTPLAIAIEVGDAVSLNLLVNNNADIDHVDAFGRTYLMHAARVGFLPAVDLLISKGADVNAMDSDGFTALSIAYRHKKDVVVNYLLKNGAKTWVEKPYDSSSQLLIKELDERWKN